MDWCGSSTPKTPEYQSINKKKHKEKGISDNTNDCEALILEDTSIYDVPSRQRAFKFVLSNN
jgi:hypothetical protein